MSFTPRRSTRRFTALAACALSLSLIAASCGGTTDDKGEKGPSEGLSGEGLNAAAGESGLSDAGKPVRGGTLVYGLEADTNDGFCLSAGQLAISGMMVVRAVYDTLTVPNAAGDYVPYLAKDITHNDTFDQWTITLRPDVKFHDGTDLDATVVKNNLDAYRGQYKMPSGATKSSLLFSFVLDNIDTVTVKDPMTVEVKTKTSWSAFPAFLFSSSRMGMMAQSQLDDEVSCSTKLVGTGPFKFVSWTKNQKLVAERNPNYWQTAPDGKPYPYADSIEFRPITDGGIRNNAIESGDINIMHTSNAADIGGKLKDLRDSGKLNMLVSEDQAETSFLQLNNTKAPFDDIRMRKAIAMAGDRDEINRIINDGLPTIADAPMPPDSPGYVKDPGFPAYDPTEAKKLIDEYRAEGKNPDFAISATTDKTVLRLAELIQQRAEKVGVKVTIVRRDQAALVNDAIGKSFQAMTFRNYPGGDPDLNYVWWYGKSADGTGTNPVNFAGFDDPEVNKLLTEGRTESDAAKRKTIYQDLSRRMATQVYGVWTWYTPWAVVEASNVHGILGPPLPGEDASKPGPASTDDPDDTPSSGLAVGHSLLGLWIAS